MELKVGMYIRSKDKNGVQYIRKIVDLPKDIRDGSIIVDKYIHNVKWVSKKNVLKSSYEKMNLIKSGDYVNGVEVKEINDKEIMLVDTQLWIDKEVANRLIESIVTKEQFESMKYVVERDK